MIGTILVVLLVVAAGARATDGVRLLQQEAILKQLPPPDALAFYKILRRRAWTVRLLRAMALLSLFAILYAVRVAGRPSASPGPEPTPIPAPGQKVRVDL